MFAQSVAAGIPRPLNWNVPDGPPDHGARPFPEKICGPNASPWAWVSAWAWVWALALESEHWRPSRYR